MVEAGTPAPAPAERPDFEQKLKDFIQICNDLIAADWTRQNFTHSKAPVVRADPGGVKFIRLVRVDDGGAGIGGSAYCFVERATGNILKPDGYKRPAKGVRGNIYDGSPGDAVTPYGARYIRR